MKYIRLIIVSVIISGLFTACDEYLEVNPENSVTFRKFFNTEQDLEVFTNGIRDDYKDLVQSGSMRFIRGFLYDDGNYYTRMAELDPEEYQYNIGFIGWRSVYNVVSSANILMKYHTKPGLDAEREKFYKGIAHFYRGYGYWFIGSMWGDAPIVKYDGDVGMKAKEPWDKVIDFAIEDAKEAVKLLPAIDKLTDSKGNSLLTRDTPSKEAAYALLAHLYAWKASMLNDDQELLEKSIAAASEVIMSSNVELAASAEEVCTSVLVGNSRESIFESQLIASETNIVNSYYVIDEYLSFPIDPEKGEGDIKWTPFRIKNTTVEAIFKEGDERRDAYFYKFEEMKAKDEAITGGYAYPYKIRRIKEDERWGGIDYILQNAVIYRLTELILLRGECYSKIPGKESLAIADMNRIRGRANAPLYDPSEGNVQYAVFKEREKELLWERHRYFDVVRNGYWKTELKGEFKNLTDQDVKDGALYLPVGNMAFIDNSLMTQNKYWLSKY